ncbi:ADH-zinc-N domain-containing protein [Mycena chlorophos]|uniref:ADH-zinc-N domain-containing protein n=1 Tax=Mycena chlorophos TaxID=658473 RepID=A0A8H6RWT6_MYCCL|nr:ADH-zinc-N domain-containing protein [Mycena chlorophos]
MLPTPNPRVIYAKVPGPGPLVAGEHLVYESAPTIDLDAPLRGGFLTKTLLLSPEPFMRERLRDPSIFTYSTPMVVGQPCRRRLRAGASPSFGEGGRQSQRLYVLYGFTPWEHYSVQPYVDARFDFASANYPSYTFDMDSMLLRPVPDPHGAFPWSRFASVLGMPGLTAFVGLESVAPDMKAYVFSGASGVGSMVVQSCKAKGLRVIASGSADSKVDFIRSLGADVAFNYKTTILASVLAEHGPLDYYWDNACGAISEYNAPAEDCYGVKTLALVFKRRLRIQGFLVSDGMSALLPRFLAEVPVLLAQGKLKSEEQLFVGLEKGIEAFLSLYDGTSKGKPVVVVDEAYA